MSSKAYSLVEVVIAAAIVAIGVAAGAAMMNTLVVQQEVNAGSVRAANLQEQATVLYRLGLTNPADLYAILPESCSGSGSPASGAFLLNFGTPTTVGNNVLLEGGGTAPISCTVTTCTLVYANPISGSGQVTYLTNVLSVVRPTIKVGP